MTANALAVSVVVVLAHERQPAADVPEADAAAEQDAEHPDGGLEGVPAVTTTGTSTAHSTTTTTAIGQPTAVE